MRLWGEEADNLRVNDFVEYDECGCLDSEISNFNVNFSARDMN